MYAQELCEESGGNLASIHDPLEQAFVSSLVCYLVSFDKLWKNIIPEKKLKYTIVWMSLLHISSVYKYVFNKHEHAVSVLFFVFFVSFN